MLKHETVSSNADLESDAKYTLKDEGLDGGGVWYSLISKNLAHYSLSLKFLLIL